VNNYFSSNFKLGVLGGGQLGKMLLTETQKFDIYTAILDSSPDAPCAKICEEFQVGDLMNFDDVYAFGKKVDVLTIEIEHVNIDALYKLEKEGLKIYPQPHVIATIQHKGKQKDFFVQHHIPTSPHHRFESKKALNTAFEQGQFTLPFVWKSAQFWL
jgi:5-(carboxyamino)imidazole ribonucleotide synthase